MAKTVQYGRSVILKFRIDGQTFVNLGEITQFSFKSDDILKENQPLGHNDISLDVLDKGGTLSFECKKTDSAIPFFFTFLNTHYKAGNTDGTRGRSPYFQVARQGAYTDGTREIMYFDKVVLHSMEESVSSSDDEVMIKFEGKYVIKRMELEGEGIATLDLDDVSAVTGAFANMVNYGENTVVYGNA